MVQAITFGNQIPQLCTPVGVDKRVVMVMSTAHPGHSERKVQRKVVEGGKMSIVEIPQPVAVEMYNRYMGGVDVSDQYLSYHNTL